MHSSQIKIELKWNVQYGARTDEEGWEEIHQKSNLLLVIIFFILHNMAADLPVGETDTLAIAWKYIYIIHIFLVWC